MRGFSKDDSGQLILLACVSIVLALVLIAAYEYSTLGAGEKSINREDMDSFYYYKNFKERYTNIYEDCEYWNSSNPTNITVFEKELKEFAILHGYSVNFIRNDTEDIIIFTDKDIRIEDKLSKEGSCP